MAPMTLYDKSSHHAGILQDNPSESQFQPGAFWKRAKEINKLASKR
jgi:hypothetical protein